MFLDVHEASHPRGLFAHQCPKCKLVRKGLRLAQDLLVYRNLHPERGEEPGYSALVVVCPMCHSSVSYNTNHGPEDEDDTFSYPARARQARLIRAAMRHPHVALPTRETPLAPFVPTDAPVPSAPAKPKRARRPRTTPARSRTAPAPSQASA